MSDLSAIVRLMDWQPLSRRSKGLEPDGPYEGIPGHLRAPISDWILSVLGGSDSESRISTVAVLVRFDVVPGRTPWNTAQRMVSHGLTDEEFGLDLIDATLKVAGEYRNKNDDLWGVLALGASVWTIGEDKESLTRAVGAEVSEAFQSAVSVEDAVSKDLREAWTNAFGRNGDPADAWDHAIKALEHLLIPIVIPNVAKPNLGGVIGTLKNNPGGKWRCSLPGKDGDHDPAALAYALELIWPDPARHGGKGTPPATTEQAQTAVSLAVALIQGHRVTPLVYKVP